MAKPAGTFSLINIILLAVLILAGFLNYSFLLKSKQLLGIGSADIFSRLSAGIKGWSGNSAGLAGNLSEDAVKLALRRGIPLVYGEKLGVSFDQVEPAMNILKQFDPTYGRQKIALSGEKLQRYVKIGSQIACEFCCGATTLVRSDGVAACGCAHSQAMRGLAAYLLQNNAAEYTDEQILRELARWKGLFFPQAMVSKISEQLKSGSYTPDIAALLLDIAVPKYDSSSVGAAAPASAPAAGQSLPSQVGGC